jgi:hypothetical protein
MSGASVNPAPGAGPPVAAKAFPFEAFILTRKRAMKLTPLL